MTSTEIINVIQKSTKVNLSTRERNWIKDNVAKRKLYIDPDNRFITLDEINMKIHTIIQNGKSRKPAKLDFSRYAIVVSYAGCCRVLLPQQ